MLLELSKIDSDRCVRARISWLLLANPTVWSHFLSTYNFREKDKIIPRPKLWTACEALPGILAHFCVRRTKFIILGVLWLQRYSFETFSSNVCILRQWMASYVIRHMRKDCRASYGWPKYLVWGRSRSVRPDRGAEYFLEVRTSWPWAKYFPVRPSHSVNTYILCALALGLAL